MLPRWLPVLVLAALAGGCALATDDVVAVEGHVLVFDEGRGCWEARLEQVAELPVAEAHCGELTQCAIRPSDGAPVYFGCTWGTRLGWRECPVGTLRGAGVCPGR